MPLQAALAALLQDNNEIERRTADELRAADKARSDLELQLAAANDALGAAEERLNALGLAKAAADCVDGGDGGCRGQAGPGNGDDNGRAGHGGGAPSPVSGALEPGEALRPRGGVLDTERKRQHAEATTAENEPPSAELGSARNAAAAAAVATAMQERVSELERATQESEQTRALAEARLEEVQRQLRQEELERSKVQVGPISSTRLW